MKIILLILLPVYCISQTISDVSGTFSNGESITIIGSNLGEKSAAPLISSYDNAMSAANFSTGSISSIWHTQGSPVLTSISPRSSHYQSDYKISYDASGAYDVIGYNYNSRSDVTYLSWWVYRDYSVWRGANANGNAKYLRLYTGSTSNQGEGNGIVFSTEWTGGSPPYVLNKTYCQPEYAPSCLGWSIAYTGTNATQSASAYLKVNFQDGDAKLQEWEHYELYQIYSTNLENGDDTSILLKNGETVYRTNNASLQTSSSADDQRNIRLGQVSGSRSEMQMEYIDQIYYDSTVAHVFISETSNLVSFTDNDNAIHNEIQVCSFWSPSSIKFTFNQGTFADSDTVYVYVVNVEGNISNGYGIIIGQNLFRPSKTNNVRIQKIKESK